MQETKVKAFLDLQEEVIQRNLCGKCGGCISFCSAGALNALGLDDEGFPHLADAYRCLGCGLCYLICPVTKELDAELRETFAWKPPIGVYRAIASARATEENVLRVATDGGVVTSLLLYMLERGYIDGAIVSRRATAFSRHPVIATSPEEILLAAGSQLSGSSHLEQLGEQYTTYSPTISAVRSLEGRRLQSVALVGTPCQVNTIRKMQCLSILPADFITYVIGLFCAENFDFAGPSGHKLAQEFGISLDDVAKLNVKEDIIFTLKNGATVHVSFESMDDLARPACLACTEFANDYADISVGGLGSPNGYTTTLIRTEKGQRMYGEAVRSGRIEERAFAELSEMSREKGRMLARITEFADWKRERSRKRASSR